MARILKVGGVGIPNIDAYVPKLKLLEQGLATLKTLAGETPTELQAIDIGKVEKALASRTALYDYVEAQHGGLRKGAKDDITSAAYQDIQEYVNHFAEAAHALRRLPAGHALPEEIVVKHLGGTVTNKMNALKGGRGDNIDARIIGVVGRDAEGEWIKNALEDRGITLLDNNRRSTATPLNYILTEDREGNALGDRHILKGVSDALKTLQLNSDYIQQAVAGLDMMLLEGGEISKKKLGPDLFEKVLDTAMANKADIAFSPCTSLAARNEDPRNHAILDKALKYSHTDMPIGFNLEELFANYLPAQIREGLPKDYAVKDAATDPYFALASAHLKLEMAHRERGMPITNNQPVAIVSDGGKGMFIMTSKPDQTLFVPAPAAHVVDTTGAGDNLAAGALIKATQLGELHRTLNPGSRQDLSDAELAEMAHFAQQCAKLAVEQQGACVPQDKILQVLRANTPVPVRGELEGVERIGNHLGKELGHGK